MPWSDEKVELLRRMWEEGVPASEIGSALGTTKNAVIGKAHRLKLNQRENPIARKPPYVVELTAHSCRWPEGHPGEAGFHFCGKPVMTGKPYCREHVARAYIQPKSAAERAA